MPAEQKLTEQEYKRATLDEALDDAKEYLESWMEVQAEWWEHLGDAHRDYATLARLAVTQDAELHMLRRAASNVRATLRGVLSDDVVNSRIDFTTEIECLDEALAAQNIKEASDAR